MACRDGGPGTDAVDVASLSVGVAAADATSDGAVPVGLALDASKRVTRWA